MFCHYCQYVPCMMPNIDQGTTKTHPIVIHLFWICYVYLAIRNLNATWSLRHLHKPTSKLHHMITPLQLHLPTIQSYFKYKILFTKYLRKCSGYTYRKVWILENDLLWIYSGDFEVLNSERLHSINVGVKISYQKGLKMTYAVAIFISKMTSV